MLTRAPLRCAKTGLTTSTNTGVNHREGLSFSESMFATAGVIVRRWRGALVRRSSEIGVA